MDIKSLKDVLNYNHESGVFTWLKTTGKARAGCNAGYINDHGYVSIRINGVGYRAHRLAWFYVYEVWPKFFIDHINGIRTDNRILNLRDVRTNENQHNRKGCQSNNKTGFLGVSKDICSGRFIANIQVNGRQRRIGSFETAEEAHKAYMQEKMIIHPSAFS